MVSLQREISARTCAKGIRDNEVTLLASIKEVTYELEVEASQVPKEVETLLVTFRDVMQDALPKELPPRREIDHEIVLEEGAKPPARAPYRMAPPELEELRRQLKELLEAEFIQPSKSPFRALVLFQRKNDGSMRLCIDYRALNKVTIKNKYPIPLIDDLFDQLGGARWFSKLDLRSGSYQVRITEKDVAKTACTTRYGSYEFLVMPLGLTNAPATFCTLMNKVLEEFLDDFVVVYLDDIVIYSTTLEDHVGHLSRVFEKLREHSLFVKKDKCLWAQSEVEFLGHIVGQGHLRMDTRKVEAIRDWRAPTRVPELRSFLGLLEVYPELLSYHCTSYGPSEEGS